MYGYEFFVDPSRCIGCRVLRERLRRVRHASRHVDDPRRLHRPREHDRDRRRRSACTATTRPARRSARPTPSRRARTAWSQSSLKPRCIACSNCVLACPFGVPKMQVAARADDEVRHVLRPHVASGCGRCARPSAPARRSTYVPAEDDRATAPRDSRSTRSSSATRRSRTKVFMMAPRGRRSHRRRRRRLHVGGRR